MPGPSKKPPVNNLKREKQVGIKPKESKLKDSIKGNTNEIKPENVSSIDLKFNQENLIQGIIFQELLNKPLALRRGYRRY